MPKKLLGQNEEYFLIELFCAFRSVMERVEVGILAIGAGAVGAAACLYWWWEIGDEYWIGREYNRRT